MGHLNRVDNDAQLRNELSSIPNTNEFVSTGQRVTTYPQSLDSDRDGTHDHDATV